MKYLNLLLFSLIFNSYIYAAEDKENKEKLERKNKFTQMRHCYATCQKIETEELLNKCEGLPIGPRFWYDRCDDSGNAYAICIANALENLKKCIQKCENDNK